MAKPMSAPGKSRSCATAFSALHLGYGVGLDMTRRDLDDNADLIEFCAAQLELR